MAPRSQTPGQTQRSTRTSGARSGVRKSALAEITIGDMILLSRDVFFQERGGQSSMSVRESLTSTSDPGSLSSRLRRRRIRALCRVFPELPEMNVIDLGGRPSNWEQLAVRPLSVLCVNIEKHSATDRIGCVEGDICDVEFVRKLGSFDLAFSNSTIEHVGGHARREQFAQVVRLIAPHRWVQTPNRYFPVEPHAVFPGFQFLPIRLRHTVGRKWPLSRLGTDGDLLEEILNIELLSESELRYYFPGDQIWKERIAGLAKSLVAYH